MIWAIANANLALVKYWGKADAAAGHPAGASLSVTLDGLSTVAGVELSSELEDDEILGLPAAPAAKVKRFLEVVRSRYGLRQRARVALTSNFPVAAGLASSASTFAALATSALAAYGRAGDPLELAELAEVARLGSGSACRSIHGGFVEWRPEGRGSVVEPVAGADHWPLSILVAVASERPKAVGSSEGMARTAATSPYYQAWIESGPADLAVVREAIRRRDLARLGRAAEGNCLRMHSAALAADPPLLYWEPATLAVVRRVWELRERGTPAYFSIDAGPQVKVICEPGVRQLVKATLAATPGVLRVLESRPGAGPSILDRPPDWARRMDDPPFHKRAAAS
jgi:diphosphomevalonate decarboxylase